MTVCRPVRLRCTARRRGLPQIQNELRPLRQGTDLHPGDGRLRSEAPIVVAFWRILYSEVSKWLEMPQLSVTLPLTRIPKAFRVGSGMPAYPYCLGRMRTAVSECAPWPTGPTRAKT